jgi:hypothetical protein
LEPEAEADASAFHSVHDAVADMDEEEDAARVFAARALDEDDLPGHNDDVDKESTNSLADEADGALNIDDMSL